MVRLLDESALLACSIYVDLNPIRAGIAKTPETSRYTSAYDRIHSGKKSRRASRGSSRRTAARLDGWLSPMTLDESSTDVDGHPQRRASNRGFLPIEWKEYLRLLDWTGRQICQDKRGSIPSDLAPILNRLQVLPETWTSVVREFGRWFGTAAGRADALAAEATRRSRQWLRGTSRSQSVFA
jgi:hypothetical protein